MVAAGCGAGSAGTTTYRNRQAVEDGAAQPVSGLLSGAGKVARADQCTNKNAQRRGACPILNPLELHHTPYASPLARLHDIDIAARIPPDPMTRPMDRVTPSRQPLAIQRQNTDHPAIMLGDINNVFVVDIKERRPDQLDRPNLQQIPLLIEHLHTIVLSIRHQQPAASIDPHPMRQIELTTLPPRLTPRKQMLRISRELMHPRIAVTIAHEHRAVRRKRDVGRQVEWPTTVRHLLPRHRTEII